MVLDITYHRSYNLPKFYRPSRYVKYKFYRTCDELNFSGALEATKENNEYCSSSNSSEGEAAVCAK